jgi:RNA polymerase sigma-70 factor, ECF subfamily
LTDITSEHSAAFGNFAAGDEPGVRSVSLLNDAELVIAAARGSEGAFAEIYSRHGLSVYSLACRLCQPKAAEDVTHEVFLELWNEPDSFDPHRGSLRSHLLTDAHRRAVNLLRRSTERAYKTDQSSAHNDRESKALSGYVNEAVRTLLTDLTDAQRSAIILAYFGGYTYQQVANRLQQSEKAIKADIRVGLARMRLAMKSD